MGALEIRNKKLRCINCLDIRRLLIIPGYPDPKIEISCHCNKSLESLLEYCSELKKITDFKLVCTKCAKEEIKHPRFCYECLSVYCSKCCDNHIPRTGDEDFLRKSIVTGHQTIHVEKIDFFCVHHQNENFIGYCQQCAMNICSLCYKEQTHQFHKIELYSALKIDKKAKDEIKQSLKKAEKKIEKNNKLIKNFCKKNKKNVNIKEIEEEFKVCSEENDDILELMKYCYNLYDHSKTKNYSIIYNLIQNSKFNLKKLKLDKNHNAEETAADITKYLKKDFFILYKRNKTNYEEFEVDNEEEQEEEEDEKDDEKEDETNNITPTNSKNNLRKNSDPKQELKDNNINNNDINEVPYSAPQNFLQTEDQTVNEPNNIHENNNIIQTKNNAQPPKVEMKKIRMPIIFKPEEKKNPYPSNLPPPKKLKMPSMFEKKEEVKNPEKPLPAKANLKMPSIFEKKEEDNKPKERAAIIKTGASGNMGDRKNLIAEMMANKGPMGGKPKNPSPTLAEAENPVEEKIEIIHESNEAGTSEEVLNKVTVNKTKKKKPSKAKFFVEGEGNQENPKPPSEPITQNSNQQNNQESQQQEQPQPQEENQNKENVING